MSQDQFTLLNQLHKDKKQQIEQQRLVLQMLLDTNNKLGRSLSNIDNRLSKPNSEENASLLVAQRQELLEQLNSGKYSDRIQKMMKDLHDLETDVYGESKVNGDSPFTL